jgi:hypothetical protein
MGCGGKVHWLPYSKSSFEKAKREDKPVLIDVSAKWCHWCRVMDEESYSDDEIAEFLNRNFVCIRVDRDELPNIDRMYQEVVSSLTGERGWPLTVFTTPEGKVFYGGTYFPREERFGKPPFLTVLKAVYNSYKEDREKTITLAEEVMEAMEKLKGKDISEIELGGDIIRNGVNSILSICDPVYGGFGFVQKFPMPSAIRLLLNVKTTYNDSIKFADQTLEEMYAGGIHDHIFGGFFRYTVDREWSTPHFEKILYDNAEILIDYVLAYRTFNRMIYKKTAEDILNFVNTFLKTDLGYFTSISADFKGKVGGFYTFLFEELKESLDEMELKAFMHFYGVGRRGNLQSLHGMELKGRNHLRIEASLESVAETMGLTVEDLERILESGRDKLAKMRMEEYDRLDIDRSVYTSYTSLFILAKMYYSVLFDETMLSECEKELNALRRGRFGDVVYRKDEVEGLLEDYSFLATSLICCYNATLNDVYLHIAEEVVDLALKEFYRDGNLVEKEGFVSINDLNHRSPVSQMVENLVSLGVVLDSKYLDIAGGILKKYAGLKHGLFNSGYLLSLQSYLAPVIIEGDRKMLIDFRKYINHNVFFKEGEESICIGTRCMKPSLEGMHRILRDVLNIGALG